MRHVEKVLEVEGPDGQIKEIKLGPVEAEGDLKDIDLDLKQPTVEVPVLKGEADVKVDKPDVSVQGPSVTVPTAEVDLKRRSRSRSSSSSSSSDDEGKDKDKKKKKKDKDKKKGFFGLFRSKSRSPSPKKETKKDKKKKGSKESTPDRHSASLDASVEVKAEAPDLNASISVPDEDVHFPEEKPRTGFEVTFPHLKLASLPIPLDAEDKDTPKSTLEKDVKPPKVKKGKAPDPNLLIVTGEIVTEEPDSRSSTLDKKKKKGFFSLGRGDKKDKKRKSSIESSKSDKSDQSKPSLGVEVQGDLPEVQADVDVPDVKLKAERKSSVSSTTSDDDKEKKHKAGFNIKLPKFKGKGSAEGDVKGPKEGFVVEDLESIEVKAPKVKRKSSTSSQTSEDDKDKEKHKAGFHIKLPKFAKKGSVEGEIDADIDSPNADVDVEAPDVSVEAPKIEAELESPDTTTSEDEKKHKGFDIHLPKVHLPKFKGKGKAEGDLDADVKGPDVDVEAPDVDVKVKGPKEGFVVEDLESIEVKAPKIKRKSSTSSQTSEEEKKHKGLDIHLPKVKLPKFGKKGSVEGEIDADIDSPDVDVDVEAPEVAVEAPKIEAELESADTTTSEDEKKHKGFDIHLPKVHLPKFKGKAKAEGDEGPKEGFVVEDLESVEVKAPKKRKSSASSQTSEEEKEKKAKAGFNIHLPDVHLPKFKSKGKGDADISVDDKDVSLEVEAPEVDIEGDVKGPDVDVDGSVSLDRKSPRKKLFGGFSLPGRGKKTPETKRKSSVSSTTSDEDHKQKKPKTDKEGFVVEDLMSVEPSAKKIKKPKGKDLDASVDVEVPSVSVESKSSSLDRKSPRTKKKLFGGFSFGKKKRDSSASTPEPKRKESVSSASDEDKEKEHKAGFNIHLPKFGGKAKVEGDVDVKGPKEGYVVEDLESVEVKKPKIKRKSSTSSQTSEDDKEKKHKAGFDIHLPKVKLPKFGKKGSVEGEVDADVDVGAPKADVDVDVKGPDVDVEAPDVDVKVKGPKEGPNEGFVVEDLESVEVKAPKIKRKSSTSSQTSEDEKKHKGFDIHFPKVKLPKFGKKGSVEGEIDADIDSPKAVDVDVEAPEVAVEAPKIEADLQLESPDVTTSEDEKKHKAGFDIHLPKVHLPKFGGKGKAEGEVEGYVVEDLESVEVKAPKVKRKSSTSSQTSEDDKEKHKFDIHLPKVKLPKFKKKGSVEGEIDADVDVDAPDVEVNGPDVDVDVDGPKVEIEGPELKRKSSTSSQTSEDDKGKRGKKFDIHLPKVKFPTFKKGSVEGEINGPKEGYVVQDLESVEVKKPKVKRGASTSSNDRQKGVDVELEGPSVSVEGKGSIDRKTPKKKLFGGFSFGGKKKKDSEESTPEVKRKSSVSSTSSDDHKDKDRKGFNIHLPKFGGKAKVEGDINGPNEGYVVEDLESVEVKKPKVKRKSSTGSQTSEDDKDKHRAGFDIHLPKVKLPKFKKKGSVEGEIDVETPNAEVDVNGPDVDVDVEAPDVSVEAPKIEAELESPDTTTSEDEKKHKGFDIHFPKVHLPKFSKKGSVEGEIDGPNEGFVVEDLESVEVKKPKVKRKSSTSSQTSEDDKDKEKHKAGFDIHLPKVKFPKFGKKGSVEDEIDADIDSPKADVDVDVEAADVSVEAPKIEAELESPDTTTSEDEKKHKGFDIHLPKVHLPKFSKKGSVEGEIDGHGPKEGYVVEDLESVEVKKPKVKRKSSTSSQTSDDDKHKIGVDVEAPSVSVEGSLDKKSPKKKAGFGGFSLGRKKKGSEPGTPDAKRKSSVSSTTSDDEKEKKHKAGFDIHLPKIGLGHKDKEEYVVKDLESVETKGEKDKDKSGTGKKKFGLGFGFKGRAKSSSESHTDTEPGTDPEGGAVEYKEGAEVKVDVPDVDINLKKPEGDVDVSLDDERDRKSKSLGRRFKELFGSSQVS